MVHTDVGHTPSAMTIRLFIRYTGLHFIYLHTNNWGKKFISRMDVRDVYGESENDCQNIKGP